MGARVLYLVYDVLVCVLCVVLSCWVFVFVCACFCIGWMWFPPRARRVLVVCFCLLYVL